jgi:hypothetical protein
VDAQPIRHFWFLQYLISEEVATTVDGGFGQIYRTEFHDVVTTVTVLMQATTDTDAA